MSSNMFATLKAAQGSNNTTPAKQVNVSTKEIWTDCHRAFGFQTSNLGNVKRLDFQLPNSNHIFKGTTWKQSNMPSMFVTMKGTRHSYEDLFKGPEEDKPKWQPTPAELKPKKKKPRGKPIKCIENGKIYASRKEAERILGLKEQAVFDSMKSGVPANGKYTFENVK